MGNTSQSNHGDLLTRQWLQAFPIVSSFVFGMVRDRHRAEDIVQEVAVAIAEQFSEQSQIESFTAWALGIARYRVYEYYRKSSRDRLVFSEDVLEMVVDAHSRLAEGITDRQQALAECVGMLKGRSRLAIELRYRDGKGVDVVASALKISYSRAASLLFRVRNQLRDCVNDRMMIAGRRHG